jgi:bacterioferritin (cytochrome b1)
MAQPSPPKDTAEMLDALNGNMNSEFKAVLQYICHRISAKNQDVLLAESFKSAALDEMSHMLFFSDLISRYGGTPIFEEWKVDQSNDIITMLETDLQLEKEARVRYARQLEQFIEFSDVTTVLTQVLADETDHEETFQKYIENLRTQ